MITYNFSTAIVIGTNSLVRLTIREALERYHITCLKEFDNNIKPIDIFDVSLTPEVIFIDIDSTQMDLFYLIEELRESGCQGILIITSSKNEQYYSKLCALSGANAFISKENLFDKIDFALNAVNIGYTAFPYYSEGYCRYNDDMKRMELLSMQEVRVMHFLISGFNNAVISQKMKINYKTVSTYKSRLMRKMKCKSIIDLIILAKENKII